MPTQEDPISPSSVAAHVLVLIILLIGGCIVEWIKHQLEPPFVTNALLSLGEGAMFIYMVGAIGKAFWWTIEQWTSGKAATQESGKELLKQFLPTKVDIGDVFKPGPWFRQVLIVLLALMIIFAVFEVMLPPSRELNAVTDARIADTREMAESNDKVFSSMKYRPVSSAELLLTLFNQYSLSLLVTLAGLVGLTILAVVSILFLQKRKQT